MIEQLPPRRSLPPAVRERMRRKVLAEHGVRSPLAAAAAVAVLVAGGAVVAQSTQGDDSAAVAPPTTTSSAPRGPLEHDLAATTPTPEELEKCGMVAADAAVALPGRRVLMTADRFCEITHVQVARSTPEQPLRAGDVALLWRSPTDVLVGLAPRGAREVAATMTGQSTPQRLSGLVVGGFFVVGPGYPLLDLVFTTPDGHAAPVRVDTRQAPDAADVREVFPASTPETDKLFPRCLDLAMRLATPGVLNPGPWRPGAYAGSDPTTGFLVMRDDADHTAYCSLEVGRAAVVNAPDEPAAADRPVTLLGASPGRHDPEEFYLGGRVGERVSRLEITDAAGRVAQVTIADGTFAALVTAPPGERTGGVESMSARALDSSGAVLYAGPLRP